MDGDGVLIVEDHPLLAQAVATALGDSGIPARVVPLDELDETVARVAPGTLVLLDLRLGPGRDGGLCVAPLVERGARVVIVTGTSDPLPLARALAAGALAVVDKHQPFADLVATVLSIRAGRAPAGDQRCREIMRAAAERRAEHEAAAAVLDRLSPREEQVLDQLCEGLSAQEIATSSSVSLTTVRTQIRSILAKLGVSSQLQAVARAHDLRRRAAVRTDHRCRPGTTGRWGGAGEAAR